jgi:hypothetical protein
VNNCQQGVFIARGAHRSSTRHTSNSTCSAISQPPRPRSGQNSANSAKATGTPPRPTPTIKRASSRHCKQSRRSTDDCGSIAPFRKGLLVLPCVSTQHWSASHVYNNDTPQASACHNVTANAQRIVSIGNRAATQPCRQSMR